MVIIPANIGFADSSPISLSEGESTLLIVEVSGTVSDEYGVGLTGSDPIGN
jgi:hypothetical protein